MSNEVKKPIEVVFAPGCFDNFDGTQEELDDLMAQIQKMADSGELMERSNPVDIDAMLDELSDEEIEDLIGQLDLEDEIGDDDTGRMLH